MSLVWKKWLTPVRVCVLVLWAVLPAAAQNLTPLVVQPGTVFFRNPSGVNLTQRVTVTGTGKAAGAFTAAVTYTFTPSSWLTATPQPDQTTLNLQVNPGSLAAGGYTAPVANSPPKFAPATLGGAMTLIPANTATPSPAFILNPDSLYFHAPALPPA